MLVCDFDLGFPALNSAVVNVCAKPNTSKEGLRANAVKLKDCGINLGCWDLESDCLNLLSELQINGYLRKAEWFVLNGLSSNYLYDEVRCVVVKNRNSKIFWLEIPTLSCLSKGISSSYSDALIVPPQT